MVKMSLYKLLIITFTLGLIGCGNDNVVDTSNMSSGGGTSSSGQIGTLSSDNLASLYALTPCSGGARMSEMYFTATNATVNGSTINANWQDGQTSGSLVDKSRYVGFSTFNDIMILEKVTTSSGTSAFNLIVSFCESQPLLIQGRSYSNFMTENGITIGDNLSCSTGNILASSTMLSAAPYNTYQSTTVRTVFTVSATGQCPF